MLVGSIVAQVAPSQRRKVLRIAPALLLPLMRLLNGDRKFELAGLPDDAAVIGCDYDLDRDDICLMVTSATFEAVPSGHQCDDLRLTIRERI